VLQEQVLSVRAGDFAAQAARFGNREERRVVMGRHLDIELREIAHQLIRRFWHLAFVSLVRSSVSPACADSPCRSIPAGWLLRADSAGPCPSADPCFGRSMLNE